MIGLALMVLDDNRNASSSGLPLVFFSGSGYARQHDRNVTFK